MISKIIIQNATQLSYKSSFEFFGGDIAFKKVEDIGLSCVFSNITNAEGSMLSRIDIDALRDKEDYQIWEINGQRYDRCKLLSFSFPSTAFNTQVTVQLTLQINKSARDLTALDGYYADYGYAFATCSFVDSISESIAVSRGENSVSYSKEINVKFSNSLLLKGANHPEVVVAQNFAKKVFDYDSANGYATIPSFGTESALRDVLNQNFRKFRSENLNLITNECSFSEKLTAQNIETDPNTYSHAATQTITVNENGVVEVSERGTVQGLVEPRNDSAQDGYEIEALTNARVRIQAIFDNYYECTTALNTQSAAIMFLASTKTIDSFNGTISYEVRANNDPKLANSENNVSYDLSTSISVQNSVTTKTYRGTIMGLGSAKLNASAAWPNKYPKYVQAKSFWTSTSPTLTSGGLSDFAVSRSETHAPYQGSITFERTFSNDPKYSRNGSGALNRIKSLTVENTLSVPREKVNAFAVINEGIIMQPTAGSNQGSQEVSVNMILYRVNPRIGNGKTEFERVLDLAKTEVQGKMEADAKLNAASCNFSFFNDVTFGLSSSFYQGLEAPDA